MGKKAEENFQPVRETVTRPRGGVRQLRKVVSASEAAEEGERAA
jgi:hypothetical protein